MSPRNINRRNVGFQNKGWGRGRMGGQFSAGPGGACVCTNPNCKTKISHLPGSPCYQQKCPKCGSPMIRS